jgi:hypothetical protein
MQEFGIEDAQLCAVIDELSSGLVHANLGGGVYKQRLARKGQGKSGGFRSIVLFRLEERAFFVFGFAKNDRASLSTRDLKDLRYLAKEMFRYDDKELEVAVKHGSLQEVFCQEPLP